MLDNDAPAWAFLTNHAQVLICIADDPAIRLREIGERVGITERAAHRIVVELTSAGYITRERNGRRNHYTINGGLPVHDPIARDRNVGQLLELLTAPRGSGPDREHSDAPAVGARGPRRLTAGVAGP